MKSTRTLAACLALALPLGVWAQDTASSPSRAQVKQEGQAALKSGETPVGDKVPDKQTTTSTTTRAQVKSAASGAQPTHDLGATQRSTHPAPKSSKSRAEVRSEAQTANRQGDLPTGDLGTGSGPDAANKPSARKATKAASAASQ